MQTEDTLIDTKKKLLNDKINFLTDIVNASARYERLLANKDFQDILTDLKNLIDLHENEIKGYLKAYSLTSSFFKKMRLAEVLGQHQLRKDQIEEAVNYPKLIVDKAVEAREELAKLKDQEKEINHV